jgi:hypothetical protein
MHDYHCSAPNHSLRLLRYLRLLDVAPGPRLATKFRLSLGYRELDADAVARLAAAAREIRPRPEGRQDAGRRQTAR